MAEDKTALEQLVRIAGGPAEKDYDELLRTATKLEVENGGLQKQIQAHSDLEGENKHLLARIKRFDAKFLKLQAEVEGFATSLQNINWGEDGATDETLDTEAKPRVKAASGPETVKKTKKRKGHKGRKASKPCDVSASRTEARKFQGQYMGRLKRFSEDEQVIYKELAREYPLNEVVAVMDSDFAKVKGKAGTRTSSKKRFTKKRAVKKGKVVKPNGSTADPKRVALQMRLLETKYQHGNGAIPRDIAQKIAAENGITVQSVNSLLATTQKSYRKSFLRRVVAVAPNMKKAHEDILSFVVYYGAPAAELLREAGLTGN